MTFTETEFFILEVLIPGNVSKPFVLDLVDLTFQQSSKYKKIEWWFFSECFKSFTEIEFSV